MKNLMIDGPVSEFPVFGQTEAQEKAIRKLYRKTFDIPAPPSADYSEIKLAIEFGDPIESE